MPIDPPVTANGDPIGVDIETNEHQKKFGRRRRAKRWIWRNLNFYRVHLLAFTLIPLIISVIFYLSNGQYHISYVDSLFLCVTSMAVCGLATVNLSTLTGFQQVLMYILMCIGHPITVSLVIIQSRLWMFEEHLEPLVRKRREEREARKQRQGTQRSWNLQVFSTFRSGTKGGKSNGDETEMEVVNSDDGSGSVKRGRLKVSMIRRMNNAPQRINPSGLVMETKPSGTQSSPPPNPMESNPLVISESPKSIPLDITAESPPIIEIRQPTGDAMYENPAESTSMYRPPTLSLANRRITRDARQNSILHDDRIGGPAMGRSQTIEFSLTRPDRVHTMDVRADSANPNGQLLLEKPEVRHSYSDDPNLHRNWTRESMERTNSRNPPGFPRTVSMASHKRRGSMHTGFGGFPTPYRVAIKLVSWVAPTTAERIRKRVTMPATHSMSIKKTKSIAAETIDAALYSQHRMKEEDLEFLGGVEYKSLKLLRLILLCYHFGIQLIAFAIIGPESARRKWLPVFENQPRFVPPAWFALFQVTSAYTNTGTSLCDQSMIPFQNASLMIIVMFVLILAGNTAFPIFLRLIIWILHKVFPENHPIKAPLHFLLHHPRRCFIYLFPSHQTWFLLTMIITLTFTDWVCFLILDIGNPVTEAVPVGHRVLIGLLQASAVRAAGFATISISALAPAVKVLYVIMMYVSVYPIAMSVRSTNVYEERSLGIFQEERMDGSDSSSLMSQEQKFGQQGASRRKIWGEYILWHAKQQLAFDMWWLGLAVWLICIIERSPLMEHAVFDIFTVLFEIVSAYGTVGLSLGIASDNYSTCGAFSTLSKLVIIAVMIRGRHRGLPIAIDRAIVLPDEYAKKKELPIPEFASKSQLASEDKRSREREIKGSMVNHDAFNYETEGLQRQVNALEVVPESGQPTPAIRPIPTSRSISPSSLSFASSRDARGQAAEKGKKPEM